MSDEQPVNWIHPELLEFLQECVPNDVKQINSYTYEIFNALFITPGELIAVGDALVFIRDNGWEGQS